MMVVIPTLSIQRSLPKRSFLKNYSLPGIQFSHFQNSDYEGRSFNTTWTTACCEQNATRHSSIHCNFCCGCQHSDQMRVWSGAKGLRNLDTEWEEFKREETGCETYVSCPLTKWTSKQQDNESDIWDKSGRCVKKTLNNTVSSLNFVIILKSNQDTAKRWCSVEAGSHTWASQITKEASKKSQILTNNHVLFGCELKQLPSMLVRAHLVLCTIWKQPIHLVYSTIFVHLSVHKLGGNDDLELW